MAERKSRCNTTEKLSQMNQIDIDNKYVSSTAYHEAGHIVTAAVQEMPMRNFGVCIDSLGMWKVLLLASSTGWVAKQLVGSDVERQRTII